MPEQTDSNKNRTAAYRLLLIEAAITAFIALLLYMSVNAVNAWSALLGGAVFIVPNFIFTGIVFWHTSEETAKRIVSQFYIGEAIKIFVTIFLFAGCFILIRPLGVPAMLGTYVLMMVINLIGLSLQSVDLTEKNKEN